MGAVAFSVACTPGVAIGLAITGGLWSASQLIWGNEINKFIDSNFGYK